MKRRSVEEQDKWRAARNREDAERGERMKRMREQARMRIEAGRASRFDWDRCDVLTLGSEGSEGDSVGGTGVE
jgi:hypothetical protein